MNKKHYVFSIMSSHKLSLNMAELGGFWLQTVEWKSFL